MKSLAIILGTRPEIIKMSPVINYCKVADLDYYIIHTNQHYSKYLDEIFFNQLRLPQPHFSLDVGSGTHGEQTGEMLQRIEKILMDVSTSFVLVHGDTNTTLAGALSAAKLNIPVGHVEAGLRSHDKKMPEEINRIITDHLSDLCFVPTENQRKILKNEGIPDSKIIVTGNTIVDVVYRNMQNLNNEILKKLNLKLKNFILTTIHRPENIWDKFRLQQIFSSIVEIGRKYDLKVLAPLHPGTLEAIDHFKLHFGSSINIIEPVGYFEFLSLIKHAKLIITDSGGIQEEACIIGTPCVTARENTERPETLEVGSNVIGGFTQSSLMLATENMIQKDNNVWKNPFGDGKSAFRIVEKILEYVTKT